MFYSILTSIMHSQMNIKQKGKLSIIMLLPFSLAMHVSLESHALSIYSKRATVCLKKRCEQETWSVLQLNLTAVQFMKRRRKQINKPLSHVVDVGCLNLLYPFLSVNRNRSYYERSNNLKEADEGKK